MIRRYLRQLIETAEENYLTNIHNELAGVAANRFLDVGCYTGDNTRRMASAVGANELHGIELDDDAIADAEQKGIRVLRQDIEAPHWDYPEDTFDFVYSNQVIEHLSSVDNFMLNIRRILKPGGHALVSTENLSGWHNVFALSLGYQPFSTANICTRKWTVGNPFSMLESGHNSPLMVHRAVFTYKALEEFLRLYEFELAKPITAGYYPFPNRIGNWLARVDRRHAVYIAFLIRKPEGS